MILRRLLRHMQNEQRVWPRYMPGGRVRTSTLGLIAAFVALFWLYQVYEPPAQPGQNPAQQVVPPGFVPDPDYTWVPRTQVEAPVTTTWRPPRTTTTTPTTTSPTETTTTTPTSPTSTPPSPTTTVVDPDGPGLLPPRTITQTPASEPVPPPVPGLPLPLP